jgi:hypothetical protein
LRSCTHSPGSHLTCTSPRYSLDPRLRLLRSASAITRASRAGQTDNMRLTGSAIALLVATVAAEPVPRAAKAPTVDLGYAVYEGSLDANNSINAFKGYVSIRVTVKRVDLTTSTAFVTLPLHWASLGSRLLKHQQRIGPRRSQPPVTLRSAHRPVLLQKLLLHMASPRLSAMRIACF